MYLEIHEIEDDEIWNVLSEWENDIEGVRLDKNSLSIGWKSQSSYRLRGWRADRALKGRFVRIYHAIEGKLLRIEWNDRLRAA